MHEAGWSGLVHGDDPERWDGREVGGRVRMGNTRTPTPDSCEYMAKTILKTNGNKVISKEICTKPVVIKMWPLHQQNQCVTNVNSRADVLRIINWWQDPAI